MNRFRVIASFLSASALLLASGHGLDATQACPTLLAAPEDD
jgi:hypothetical protein